MAPEERMNLHIAYQKEYEEKQPAEYSGLIDDFKKFALTKGINLRDFWLHTKMKRHIVSKEFISLLYRNNYLMMYKTSYYVKNVR